MQKIYAVLLGALIATPALAAGSADNNEIKRQRLAREQVTANLNDPDSAQFQNQSGFCGEVNSKNALGGYVGYQRFIAAGRDMVVLERDRTLARGAFDSAWNEFCR